MEKRIDEAAEHNPDGSVKRTVAQVLVDETKVGLPAEIAAQFAGVSVRTFRNYMTEGRAVLARVAQQPDLDLTDNERRMAQFATDVLAAQALFVRNANVVMEAAIRSRQRTVTKVKTEQRVDPETGRERAYEVERTTTTSQEPIELGPLMWRLSKLAPSVYGPLPRYEQVGADGGTEVVDIGARLDAYLLQIAEALQVQPEEYGPPRPEVV